MGARLTHASFVIRALSASPRMVAETSRARVVLAALLAQSASQHMMAVARRTRPRSARPASQLGAFAASIALCAPHMTVGLRRTRACAASTTLRAVPHLMVGHMN